MTRRNKARGVVVITGGTAGVGRAVARRFARAGFSVAVLARGRAGLDATLAELRELGGAALALQVDVADDAQVFDAADRIEQELGPIEIWVNNAMVTVYGRVEEVTPEEFQRVTDVNFHGYVWGAQAALRTMRPRNRGVIVQVGSSLSYRGIPLQAPYCASKHAIRGFTDALRAELMHDRVDVHVCMVQLPALNTPQFDHCLNKMAYRPQPVAPIYQPEVAAEAVFYAAHHRRRELYVTPSTIKAIIAQALAPGLADRYVASVVWKGQQSEEPARHGLSNLFVPVDTAPGARGRFDERARERDPVLGLTNALGERGVRTLALAAPLVGVGLALGWLLRQSSSSRTSVNRPSLPPARNQQIPYPPRSTRGRSDLRLA